MENQNKITLLPSLATKMSFYLEKIIRKIFSYLSFKNKSYFSDSVRGKHTKFYESYAISNTCIGDYTYISFNCRISFCEIGKFCSIGPYFRCGLGIHPLKWISTHPMFYSTLKQNGITLSKNDKIEERKKIIIGNDVFIGANVTVLDGVTIWDGAVIWAWAVVSKDIPAYAIAVGCPIVIKGYRFEADVISKFSRIKWWDFKPEKLGLIEEHFFDVDKFTKHFYS